jgi:hypothetical protein
VTHRKMTLTYPHIDPQSSTGGSQYRVDTIAGSTVYKPGQMLCELEVKDLCEQSGKWTITMRHNTEKR